MTFQKFYAARTTTSRAYVRLIFDSIQKHPLYKAKMSVCMFVTYSSVTSVPIIIPYVREKVLVKKYVEEVVAKMGKRTNNCPFLYMLRLG